MCRQFKDYNYDTAVGTAVSEDAKTATVARINVGQQDPSGLLRDLKPALMRTCTRMYGNEYNYQLLMNFLDLSKEIATAQYLKQANKRPGGRMKLEPVKAVDEIATAEVQAAAVPDVQEGTEVSCTPMEDAKQIMQAAKAEKAEKAAKAENTGKTSKKAGGNAKDK